jgi:protocatechuate 3,4-dioxygenase beta subunit
VIAPSLSLTVAAVWLVCPVHAQTRTVSGVITGQVVDEFGDPVVNARVVAESVATSASPARVRSSVSTDDRGEYRLAAPNEPFTVAVVRVSGMMLFNAGTAINISTGGRAEPEKLYYPGTAAAAEAEALRIAVGEERARVDFVLAAAPPLLPPITALRLAQAGGAPPPDPDAPASISGRVTTTDGRPIPRAHVQLLAEGSPRLARVVPTDADGRFEFRQLPSGRFSLTASKVGFAARESENPRSMFGDPARTVELRSGEAHDRLDITLARWSAVSGTVLDAAGAPLAGASVQLLDIRYSAGRRRLVPVGQAANLTDDLGRYRVYAVPPGRYVISAAVGGASTADLPGYARGYYPSTSEASNAQFVSIGLSQEVSGIDFALSRTRTAKIAGQVRNAAGLPANPGSLNLISSARSVSIVGIPVGARLSPDGAFEFPNVPPGRYIIRADRGRSNATEGEFGVLPVSIDGADVSGLVLQTSAGSSITGRFRFEQINDAKLPPPSSIELSPMPVDYDQAPSNSATADIHADWTFELHGINGPRRLQLLRLPAGWTLKEIRARGAEVTDRPIAFGAANQSLNGVEIVLTDRLSEIAGTVTDDQGRPAAHASLVAFSSDRDTWYGASRFLRRSSADADGAFALAGLPFGSYYIVALTRMPPGDDWQDPAFLESLIPRASTATIREGQKQTMTLRVSTP